VNRTEEYGKKHSISVATFFEKGAGLLKMQIVVGEGDSLMRQITESAINRPGLALTGFYKYFAYRRVQVIGWAEYAYLSSIKKSEKQERLRKFFSTKIPCVVVARGMKIIPEIISCAREAGVPVFQSTMVTKDFINAATILLENLMSPRINVHGTMVEILGLGILIEGDAGMGKSETALSLIKRGHALVSDDITVLRVDSTGSIIASPVSTTRYHMEIKGMGIIHVPSLFGISSVRDEKKLDFIVTLCKPGEEGGVDLTGRQERKRKILGVEIPQVMIPVAPGRDIANIVETAALDYKLRQMGHDAVKELDARIISLMREGSSGEK
jgi:HPr kinase/phosphorylase